MIKRVAIGFLAVCLFGMNAIQTRAATTKVRWATIEGTASAPAAGACTEPGYDAVCRSGQCECIEVPNANVGKISGKPILAGTGKANLFLTFDSGAEMPTGQGNCIPFFGIAELTTERGSAALNETLNLVGINCDPVEDTNQHVLGGFGISKNTLPPPPSKGFGKMTGFLNRSSTGEVSLTIHGPITQ
jgi:hypothetical protein